MLERITHDDGVKVIDISGRKRSSVDQDCDNYMDCEKKHTHPSCGTVYLAACLDGNIKNISKEAQIWGQEEESHVNN